MQWYYVKDGQQLGPYNDADFVELVDNGTVKPKTLVWNETMTDWQLCRSVRKIISRIADETRNDNAQCHAEFVSDADEVYVSGDENSVKGEIPNAELTARAREALEGKWLMAVVLTLLYIVTHF
ncbi:MAG: DUF4339 domain-containing protein [Kiritimatiellia bacterium]